MCMCMCMYLPTQGSNAFESRHGGAPLLQNELVAQIAAKHRVSPAQALHTYKLHVHVHIVHAYATDG